MKKSREDLPMINVDVKYLQSKGISLSTVVSRGERVFLNKVCNLGQGGDIRKLDVNLVNKRLVNI